MKTVVVLHGVEAENKTLLKVIYLDSPSGWLLIFLQFYLLGCLPLLPQLFCKLLIKLFLMSFFLQTERKTNLEKVGTPAPCDYAPNLSINKAKFANVPFGSTQTLNRLGSKNKQTNPEKVDKQYEEVFVVNDLNIKIRAQDQTSSVFKSGVERFQHNTIEDKPGPGQYELSGSRITKLSQSKSFASIIPHYTIVNQKHTVPSIPIDNLGFKEDDNNEMKKVQVQTADPPHPGSYQLRSNLTAKGVLAWKAGKLVSKEPERLPGPGQYNYERKPSKSLSSCFVSSTDRFGKIKKFREEKLPGPGAYEFEKKQKPSHNMSTQSYFNSKTTRFQRDVNDSSVGPGMYFNEKQKSHSVAHFKRSTNKEEQTSKVVNRQTLFDSKNSNPGPGEYRTNFGMSYQLHKALLRKQTTDTLPKQKRKVFDIKQQQANPGPGTYQSQQVHKMPKGKLWKKTEVVNLKQQQEFTPSPLQYSNLHHTIQARIKQKSSKLTLTEEKPFNSGTERFKHYSNPSKQQQMSTYEQVEDQEPVDIMKVAQTKKVKRLVMTTIKVRVPFGISSNKFEEKPTTYQGPDFYSKTSSWTKPTFNIKGKLQS